ncbi:hypothetical protein E2562_026842 [Oryza meyeriana var. granulata]|uniref:Uncharacterized protein n=1 Tax=Oryza meyeriana var. granulata TaxID=110450 RepID=A0A6G1D8B0_9ORYZ|nr:hypothetical protein E2562_026842 [Oryza meyeriana var. granulata]
MPPRHGGRRGLTAVRAVRADGGGGAVVAAAAAAPAAHLHRRQPPVFGILLSVHGAAEKREDPPAAAAMATPSPTAALRALARPHSIALAYHVATPAAGAAPAMATSDPQFGQTLRRDQEQG